MTSSHQPSSVEPPRSWVDLIRLIHSFVSMCLDVMPARAFDMIVWQYDLEGVGYVYRQGRPSFPNEQEKAQASKEALRWFNRALEQMLETAEAEIPEERRTIRDALKVIRGQNIEEVMGAFAEARVDHLSKDP